MNKQEFIDWINKAANIDTTILENEQINIVMREIAYTSYLKGRIDARTECVENILKVIS